MFPYDEGQTFQQAVFLKDGKDAFAEVFGRPPSTTSVQGYTRNVTSTKSQRRLRCCRNRRPIRRLLWPAVWENWTKVISLCQYLDEDVAEALGPRLKGGTYRIDESKPDHRMVLFYVSEWEDESAAAQYFDAYRKVLKGKWKQFEVSSEDTTHLAGKSEDGYFAVTRTGTLVLSKEGFAEVVN